MNWFQRLFAGGLIDSLTDENKKLCSKIKDLEFRVSSLTTTNRELISDKDALENKIKGIQAMLSDEIALTTKLKEENDKLSNPATPIRLVEDYEAPKKAKRTPTKKTGDK